MPPITVQPRWDYEVLQLVLDHIKFNDSWTDELYPLGGVHIQPKPIECKLDVIEINHLFCNMHDEGLTGSVNVNIFHTDTCRIKELERCVKLIMDESYLEGFVFDFGFNKLFKLPHDKWCGGNRYNYNMSFTEFKNKYGNKSED